MAEQKGKELPNNKCKSKIHLLGQDPANHGTDNPQHKVIPRMQAFVFVSERAGHKALNSRTNFEFRNKLQQLPVNEFISQ